MKVNLLKIKLDVTVNNNLLFYSFTVLQAEGVWLRFTGFSTVSSKNSFFFL